jgi:predicted AAA+ superfamily ATPase
MSKKADFEGWGCSSVVKCLSSIYKVLHLIPRTTKKKKEKKRKERKLILLAQGAVG